MVRRVHPRGSRRPALGRAVPADGNPEHGNPEHENGAPTRVGAPFSLGAGYGRYGSARCTGGAVFQSGRPSSGVPTGLLPPERCVHCA